MSLTQSGRLAQLLQLTKALRKDPVNIFKLVGGFYWSEQARILRAIFKYRKVAAKTCHGIGKSFIVSKAAFAWLYAWPKNNIVLTTAPTFRQVKKIIWREMKKTHEQSTIPLGGKMLETEYKLNSTAHAFGFSAKNSDTAQGIHEEHILAILDEAGGIQADIKEAIDVICIGKHNHVVLIGNPTDPAGFFADAFKQSTYHKISITAFDTPNFKYNGIKTPEQLEAMSYEEVEALPLPCPYLITPLWVFEKIEEWGIDSSPFRVRVMAEFPVEGDDILIPYKWCELALHLDETEFVYTRNLKVIGIDVARYGDNFTVLTGIDQHKMLEQDKYQGKDTMKTVVRAKEMAKRIDFNKELDMFVVDDTGVGGGVTDRLRELGYNVKRVNFGCKTTKTVAAGETNPVRLKDEIFWYVRTVIKSQSFKLLDKGQVLSQMSNVRYNITTDDKFQVLSKDDMVKKMKQKSPDDADSLALALWGFHGSGTIAGKAVGGSSMGRGSLQSAF